jgi:hypothetical protein
VEETAISLQNELYKATDDIIQQECRLNKHYGRYASVNNPSVPQIEKMELPSVQTILKFPVNAYHEESTSSNGVIWLESTENPQNTQNIVDSTETPPPYEDTVMASSP